jgi:hypothetical protein
MATLQIEHLNPIVLTIANQHALHGINDD